MEEKQSKISTEPYKGVRDFYPEDKFVQNYIFDTWRSAVEKFGYAEYDASILEPAELYRAKSGEEIVNEQTYTFTDRGDRDVTLRPEMTPTVARMVAARKRELSFPLRWYSIPNLFRYERPQKGRLREHWQLNVDLFGVEANEADAEMIAIAHAIMLAFGAKESDFEIKVNDRRILNALFSSFGISGDEAYSVSKLIDKRAKISAAEFEEGLAPYLGERSKDLTATLDDPKALSSTLSGNADFAALEALVAQLKKTGIGNITIAPSVTRGFDYYTGVVFEIFDTNPENRRSMFGGGRYDRLLEIFGSEKVPAVGFGMGDVTLHDFLESRNLLPAYASPARVYVCTADEASHDAAAKIAAKLREASINTALDMSGKKLGDQLKKAEKDAIPFALIVGENETATGTYKLKELSTREERNLPLGEIIQILANASEK